MAQRHLPRGAHAPGVPPVDAPPTVPLRALARGRHRRWRLRVRLARRQTAHARRSNNRFPQIATIITFVLPAGITKADDKSPRDIRAAAFCPGPGMLSELVQTTTFTGGSAISSWLRRNR